MSPRQETITQLVYASVDELNEMLAPGQRLQKALNTPILGPGGGLDSLGFVNFVSLIEDKYFERFDRRIILTQPAAELNGNHPYDSIGSLVAYIDSLENS